MTCSMCCILTPSISLSLSHPNPNRLPSPSLSPPRCSLSLANMHECTNLNPPRCAQRLHMSLTLCTPRPFRRTESYPFWHTHTCACLIYFWSQLCTALCMLTTTDRWLMHAAHVHHSHIIYRSHHATYSYSWSRRGNESLYSCLSAYARVPVHWPKQANQ